MDDLLSELNISEIQKLKQQLVQVCFPPPWQTENIVCLLTVKDIADLYDPVLVNNTQEKIGQWIAEEQIEEI